MAMTNAAADRDATEFADYRARAQAALFGSLPAHIDRLGWDADRIAAFQQERIRALLSVAKERSAFHARRLAGVEPDRFELSDLPRLPVMTKSAMMAHFDEVVTTASVTRAGAEAAIAATTTLPLPIDGQYLVLASGGSSGERGLFVFDPDAFGEFGACLMRAAIARMQAAGGPPAAVATFAMVAAGSSVHATGVAPRMLEGSMVQFVPVPVTLPLEDIVDHLNALQPVAVYGYPSVLGRLAHEQLAGRLRITPASITSTSETLRAHQRELIGDAFGAPIVNTYGSSEGLVGTSGPDETVLTFASDSCIAELVDDDDQPVAPGTPSSAVLVTNLFNHVQPLIRYRIEDRFTLRTEGDAPGHLRAEVEGRASELLRVGEVTIHPLVLATHLTRATGVVDYAIQPTPTGVHIPVVAGGPIDTARLTDLLRRALADAGVVDGEITMEIVDDFDRHPDTGKVITRQAGDGTR